MYRNQQVTSEFELCTRATFSMLQSTKDPRQYTQCWCHKCRGGTINKRTERNHRDHPRAANAPTSESGLLAQCGSSSRVRNTIEERSVVDGDRSGKRRRVEGEAESQVCFLVSDITFTKCGHSRRLVLTITQIYRIRYSIELCSSHFS